VLKRDGWSFHTSIRLDLPLRYAAQAASPVFKAAMPRHMDSMTRVRHLPATSFLRKESLGFRPRGR
jgi:hypothetical protein